MSYLRHFSVSIATMRNYTNMFYPSKRGLLISIAWIKFLSYQRKWNTKIANLAITLYKMTGNDEQIGK